MLNLWGPFCLAILAFSIPLSVALPTVGNGRLSSISSGDTPTNRDYGGFNIPNPSISFGLPSMREVRAYVTGRLRNKQRRGPEVGNLYRLPAAPTDAVQPHKAPVPDSAVVSVNSASQPQNPNPAKQPYDEVSATDLDDVLRQGHGSSANKLDDVVQSMVSSGSATPSPITYSKDGATITYEDVDPKSLSNSLGIISHSRFEVEDRGKKKRDQPEGQGHGKYRKEALNSTKYIIVPTIWNSNMSIDDLDYWETRDLDTYLELEDFIRRHRGKPRTNGSSSTGLSPASPSAKTINAATPYNSTKSSSAASPPPKSLAKALGLISHALFRDRIHRGHRRNVVRYVTLKTGRAGVEKEPASEFPLLVLSREGDSPKTRRDIDDDPLETVDISNEAYDEFRKKHPTFFGSGWKKERSLHTITDSGRGLHPRNPVAPSWLAILLSPSALLEKRPIAAASSVQKRDISQGTPDNESQWVPNEGLISSKTALSSPEKGAPSSLETSDTHTIERRDILSQYKNSITHENMRTGSAHRREEWLKAYRNDRKRNGERQTPPTSPVRRNVLYRYANNMARQDLGDPGDGMGAPHTDEWFESAFTEAWDEEHSKRMT